MPEGEGATHAAHGVGGFLKSQTGPLPNWAWLLVIGGGIAAAYLVPKFFGGKSSSTGTDAAGATTAGSCPEGFYYMPMTVGAQVPAGSMTTEGGYCVPVNQQVPPPPSSNPPPAPGGCTPPGVYNPTTRQCENPPGPTPPKCGTNEVYDANMKKCRCMAPNVFKNGKCEKPPAKPPPKPCKKGCHWDSDHDKCICDDDTRSGGAGPTEFVTPDIYVPAWPGGTQQQRLY